MKCPFCQELHGVEMRLGGAPVVRCLSVPTDQMWGFNNGYLIQVT